MKDLSTALDEYLAIRRSLGFELRTVERSLRDFLIFLEVEETSHITTELAVRWAKRSSTVQPATWATRLSAVRRFAAWRATTDPRTEVPPDGLLPYKYHRKSPYLYTDAEIDGLLQATAKLASAKGLRAATYSTFLALLVVTGMRMSEAVDLDSEDVDLDNGILTIRRTKFGKSRLIPLHSSTCEALARYAEAVQGVYPHTSTPGFFVSDRGERITEWSARYNFAIVSQQIGLRPPAQGFRHGQGPRLHDLRHRFAVKTLIDWYRQGRDVERELPRLATYLGHVHVNDTYWYLEAVPELLQLATDRLLQRREGVAR